MKARIPKNFGGMPNNMQSMIQQAQKMQEDITKKQAEIDEMEFTASVGGGAVEVVMSGKKELKAITIKPEVVDPEDVEMLQDLVISAVNEALRNVEANGQGYRRSEHSWPGIRGAADGISGSAASEADRAF